MDSLGMIKAGLDQSRSWFMALLNEARDCATTMPTSNGGNCPLWCLGHVVHSEAGMVAGFILGKDNPLADWDDLFGKGSQPRPDASAYPSLDELVARFETVRGDTLRVLEGLSERDLDQASHAPKPLAGMFGTVGQCFVMLGLHAAFHAGQVADARRTAGHKPLLG